MSTARITRLRLAPHGGRHTRNGGFGARLDVRRGHTMRHVPPTPPPGLR